MGSGKRLLWLLLPLVVGCSDAVDNSNTQPPPQQVVSPGYLQTFPLILNAGGKLDSLLTVDTAERATFFVQSWHEIEGAFQLLAAPVDQAVPLYRCSGTENGQTKHYFSLDKSCGGHIPEKTLGYISTVSTHAMPKPLRHCQWSAGDRNYDFPVLDGNCPDGAVDRGLLGYVHDPSSKALVGVNILPPPPPYEVKLIYRLYNQVTGDYLFSENAAESQNDGYQFQGPAFAVLDVPLDDTMIALYRCFNSSASLHFVSTSSSCEGAILESQYGWIFATSNSNASVAGALYRFQDPKNPSIVVTTSLQEGNQAGWTLIGLQGYQYDAGIPSLSDSSSTLFTYAAGGERLALNEGDDYNTYAYAPSIMKLPNGKYYMWACSGISFGGDSVVFTSSSDGINWTPQTIALQSFDALSPDTDGYYSNACDPSVVQFTPVPGGPTYYYMFFSMTLKNISTVNGVARSTSPSGPFAVYIGGDPKVDANWTTQIDSNHKPYVIQQPMNLPCDETKCYGAGQPTVVVKDGAFQMWYTDTTAVPWGILYTTSPDGVNWTAAQTTSVTGWSSVDVKFDAVSGQYLMYGVSEGDGTPSTGAVFLSRDGLSWTRSYVYNGDSLPPHSHNPGILGDPNGNLIRGSSFVGFGAPYRLWDSTYSTSCDTATDPSLCPGHWNLWTTPFFPLFQRPALQ